MKLVRVAEVSIVVRDLDAALRFYRDVLELPVLREGAESVALAAGAVPLVFRDHAALDPGHPADCISELTFQAEGLGAKEEDALEIQGARVRLAAPGRIEPVPPDLPSPFVKNIDHIVIASGDSGSTAAAFESTISLEIRRKMIRPGTNAQLAFAKLGEVIIEFAGPPEPRPGPVTARYWGLAFNVRNLDGLVERVREAGLPGGDPKPAVQPGARIASVKGGTGGVPVALMEYAE